MPVSENWKAPRVKTTVDAQIETPTAKAELLRFDNFGFPESRIPARSRCWIDLCLTPRASEARACYAMRWNPGRFERIGKVFLVPPQEELTIRSDGGVPHTSIVCQLDPQALSEALETDLEWTDRQLESALDIQHRYIRSLLIRLAGETKHPTFASAVFVEHLVGQLAIEIARDCRRAQVNLAQASGLSSWRLRLIDERLREERASPSLSELAQLCRLSVRQLSRGFKTSRGYSIGDHVANCRIEHAKRMLLAGDNIKATAQVLGFASAASFGYAFRRATGVTPASYQRRAPG